MTYKMTAKEIRSATLKRHGINSDRAHQLDILVKQLDKVSLDGNPRIQSGYNIDDFKEEIQI